METRTMRIIGQVLVGIGITTAIIAGTLAQQGVTLTAGYMLTLVAALGVFVAGSVMLGCAWLEEGWRYRSVARAARELASSATNGSATADVLNVVRGQRFGSGR